MQRVRIWVVDVGGKIRGIFDGEREALKFANALHPSERPSTSVWEL